MLLPPMIQRSLRLVLDYALPPRCPGCGCVVEEDHQFCVVCWQGMDFLGEPCCARCGIPFDMEQGEGAQCGACLAHPPVFHSARAVLAYGDTARHVALRLKYGRRLGLARLMALHMARRLPDGAGQDWRIVPVPLHRWRQWNRGFNQSALIADHMARASGIQAEKRALVRHRSTAPLHTMNPTERRNMVRGAFSIEQAFADRVAGRHIILIDDVHTTGVTAQACAKTLLRGGALSVHLLCWARVVSKEERD